MEAREVTQSISEGVGITFRGKILVVDDDARNLQATSASLRQEGFDVRAFVSYPDGLSCLASEHFDLVMVKLGKIPSCEDEKFWSVRSRPPAPGLSCFWQAVSIGLVTVMWRSWELWTN